jgi:hypothetical protein
MPNGQRRVHQSSSQMPNDTIQVKRKSDGDPMEFYVTVEQGQSQSRHHVTMGRTTYRQLTDEQVTPERCIQAAFEFLLAHEPKESILSRFDVTVIPTYFPSFVSEIKHRLHTSGE